MNLLKTTAASLLLAASLVATFAMEKPWGHGSGHHGHGHMYGHMYHHGHAYGAGYTHQHHGHGHGSNVPHETYNN